MARSVLMMGRAKNDGKIYLSHEKNSYARPQQTVLLHIDDVEVEGVKTARAVFDGYTDKKDADFIEERRVRTAETRQDTRKRHPERSVREPPWVDAQQRAARRRPAGDWVQRQYIQPCVQ